MDQEQATRNHHRQRQDLANNLPCQTSSSVAVAAASEVPLDLQVLESTTLASYQTPNFNLNASLLPPAKAVEWVHNPSDGSVLLDHKGQPISVDKLLSTKPLRHELSTRPGPGNKKLTYISGEGVSRTLNDIFGFDGWNLDIKKIEREECLKENGRYTLVYTAMVRLTHRKSGAYKEDCGAGDSTDKSFGTAVAHAMKGSITDALKRAARHFGDKLGNSLYQGNFSASKAPTTLKDALDQKDIERANTKFGFPKDQVKSTVPPPTTPSATTSMPTNHPAAAAAQSKPPATNYPQRNPSGPPPQYVSSNGRVPPPASHPPVPPPHQAHRTTANHTPTTNRTAPHHCNTIPMAAHSHPNVVPVPRTANHHPYNAGNHVSRPAETTNYNTPRPAENTNHTIVRNGNPHHHPQVAHHANNTSRVDPTNVPQNWNSNQRQMNHSTGTSHPAKNSHPPNANGNCSYSTLQPNAPQPRTHVNVNVDSSHLETANRSGQPNNNNSKDQERYHHQGNHSDNTIVTQTTTTAPPYAMPPPTAADGLFNSSLFGLQQSSDNNINNTNHNRPTSSIGRKDGSRRISIGDGIPIQPAPLVTPVSSTTTTSSGKRPPFSNVQNIDPTVHKKQNVNPYYSSR